MGRSEQKIERELQVRRHVIQTALLALQYLLRLCVESTRRQMHLSLPELENEIYRLDSTANYDANGDGVGATLLHVAAEDGNAELMGEVLRKEHGVDVSHCPYRYCRPSSIGIHASLIVRGCLAALDEAPRRHHTALRRCSPRSGGRSALAAGQRR